MRRTFERIAAPGAIWGLAALAALAGAGIAPRAAFGQQPAMQSVAAMTVDYLDPAGVRQRTPSRIGYGGDMEIAYCERAATDGTPENAAVAAAFAEAYRAARPWDAGQLEIRCDGQRLVPFSATATPVDIPTDIPGSP